MRRFHRTIIGMVVGFAFVMMVLGDLAFFTAQMIWADNADTAVIWFWGAIVSLVPQFVALHFFQKYFVPWVDKPDEPQKRPGSHIERS